MNIDDEIICGYAVSSKMKRLWAMEMEMVKKLVSVCNQYGLTCFIMGGTLLGAVRHKGFIPWDNDVDFIMPRKDFNVLLEIGPSVFKKPFFFQTPVTEQSSYFRTHAKIRDERGTMASQEQYESGINCGVYIDVFCLDETPNGTLMRKLFYWKMNEITKMTRFFLKRELSGGIMRSIKHGIQKLVYKYVYGSPDAAMLFEIYQKAAGKYAGRGMDKVEHLAFGHEDCYMWNRTEWSRSIQLDFEGMKLPAPIGWDAILKHQFGDYLQIPDDKSTHVFFEFDPDIPYKQYFLMKHNYQICQQ